MRPNKNLTLLVLIMVFHKPVIAYIQTNTCLNIIISNTQSSLENTLYGYPGTVLVDKKYAYDIPSKSNTYNPVPMQVKASYTGGEPAVNCKLEWQGNNNSANVFPINGGYTNKDGISAAWVIPKSDEQNNQILVSSPDKKASKKLSYILSHTTGHLVI